MASNETELLRELGRLAAEQQGPAAEDETLGALCEGDLTAEARKELRRRAEGDVQLVRAIEAYEPLDDAARQRIADRIVNGLRAGELGAAPRRVVPWSEKRAERGLRAHRPRLFNWIAVPLAAAAALLLWLMYPGRWDAGSQALPRYALQAEGSVQQVRGNAPTAARRVTLSRHGELTVLLRPGTAVRGEISTGAFVRGADNWKRIPAQAQTSPSGAVRVVLAARRLAETGVRAPYPVCLLIARPPAFGDQAARLAFADASGRGWQRFCIVIDAVDGPGR